MAGTLIHIVNYTHGREISAYVFELKQTHRILQAGQNHYQFVFLYQIFIMQVGTIP